MGILIPNVDFPQSCNDCPLNYDSIDCMAKFEISLRNAEHEFLYEDKRHPDCPLIEQKTGKWLHTPTYWVYCSVCDREPPNETNERTPYCPWCGAKMENY